MFDFPDFGFSVNFDNYHGVCTVNEIKINVVGSIVTIVLYYFTNFDSCRPIYLQAPLEKIIKLELFLEGMKMHKSALIAGND